MLQAFSFLMEKSCRGHLLVVTHSRVKRWVALPLGVRLRLLQAPLGHTHASVSRDEDWKAERCPEAEQEGQEAERVGGEEGKGMTTSGRSVSDGTALAYRHC